MSEHQAGLVADLLKHRQWIIDSLGDPAPGLGGDLCEQSFCHPQWLPNFNHYVGNAKRFRGVDPQDGVSVAVADLVDRLSLSLAASLGSAIEDGFEVRAAEGWQFSFGGKRGPHPDKGHLGDLILTVTLDGDCSVSVGDALVSYGESERDPWTIQQDAGAYYSIWGDSRWFVRHWVDAGSAPRLSLTLRFGPRSLPGAAGSSSTVQQEEHAKSEDIDRRERRTADRARSKQQRTQ